MMHFIMLIAKLWKLFKINLHFPLIYSFTMNHIQRQLQLLRIVIIILQVELKKLILL